MPNSPRTAPSRSFAALILALVIALTVAAASTIAGPASADGGDHLTVSHPAPASPAGHGTPPEDRAHGMVWTGLADGHADCEHEFKVVGVAMPMCSHGPDEPSDDINVQERPSTVELAGTVTDGSTSTGGAVPCYGDGSTGSRIQAVYAHAADVPGRYSEVVGLIGQWAGAVDAIFRDSAAETGGVRHVRWVTDASCNLSVLDVELSANGDNDYSAMVNELQSLGLNRHDRHYVVWADATVYCGIGGFIDDDRAGSNNGNNGGPAYARVDSACWGKTNAVEAHELMHTLGGVQYSAPHSSGGGHCSDDYDRMCYADSSSVTMTYGCASSHERVFDCGHDDYFHTLPPNGSYLSGHWNAADSVFLERANPTTWAPTTTTSTTSSTTTPTTTPTGTPTTTSTTAPPATNLAETWSGSLNRKTAARSYTFSSGSGSLTSSLRFTSSPSLTLVVRASDGTVLAQTQGASVLQLSTAVPAGSYTITVSSSGTNAKYTLSLVHPSA